MYLWLVVVSGHIFPFLGYKKGGKGVATFLGALLAYNWIIATLLCSVWYLIYIITQHPSLSSLFMILFATLIGVVHLNLGVVLPLMLLTLIISLSHKDNISHLSFNK